MVEAGLRPMSLGAPAIAGDAAKNVWEPRTAQERQNHPRVAAIPLQATQRPLETICGHSGEGVVRSRRRMVATYTGTASAW